jgi:hypothetical protein
MSRVVTNIERVKGMSYKVDKNGNVVESSYNWFSDPSTLVMLVIVILGGLYYYEMTNSATNAENFGPYCMKYLDMVSFWNDNNNETWLGNESINKLINFYELNYNKANNIPLYG